MGLSKAYLNNIQKSYSASRLRRLQVDSEENIKARVQRLKKEMTEIGEDHKNIKAGQREVRNKIKEIKSECAQLREETKLMFNQSTCIKRGLHIMSHILQAPQRGGDFVKAQKLTELLCICKSSKCLEWSSKSWSSSTAYICCVKFIRN